MNLLTEQFELRATAQQKKDTQLKTVKADSVVADPVTKANRPEGKLSLGQTR